MGGGEEGEGETGVGERVGRGVGGVVEGEMREVLGMGLRKCYCR